LSPPISLAILGSTNGTLMMDLIHAISKRELNADICMVMSNQADAGILERAKIYQVPHAFVDTKTFTREAYDEVLAQQLSALPVDLIVLIGYMRILTRAFVKRFHERMINVHPSLLPAFAGKMDRAVHQAVLDSGVKTTGCTVHFVTEEVDKGTIIVQKTCDVLPNDTVELLRKRVQGLEGLALIEAIKIFKSRLDDSNKDKTGAAFCIQ
jgi:phosphoribosylglycinamide formyltransferase-1